MVLVAYQVVYRGFVGAMEEMLRADARSLPAETEPTVKSAASKRINKHISSLIRESNWNRAEYEIGNRLSLF